MSEMEFVELSVEKAVEQEKPKAYSEAAEYLKIKGIKYFSFGSSALNALGRPVIPNDIDIVMLEDDERAKIKHEFEIDEFNSRSLFHIDDSFSRQGVTYCQEGDLYVYPSSGRVFRLKEIKFGNKFGLPVLDPQSYSDFQRAYIDGMGDNPKGLQTLDYLQKHFEGVNADNPLEVADGRTRDYSGRSFEDFVFLIEAAERDFSRVCGLTGNTGELRLRFPFTDIHALALKRLAAGRLVMPFTMTNPTQVFGLRDYEILYNRWKNFGREILFHQLELETAGAKIIQTRTLSRG